MFNALGQLFRRKAAAGAAIAATFGLGALAAPAHAQTLELFDGTNFAGFSQQFRGEVGDLGRTGFNDQARSLRFTSGAWEVCEHANFEGRCVTVERPVEDLAAIGLNRQISSFRPVAAGGGGGRNGEVILFTEPNFRGNAVRISTDTRNLGDVRFNDRARSAQVRGTWTLCEHANFEGLCETVSSDIADLWQINLSGRISSVTPTAGVVRPGPGRPPIAGPRPDMRRVDRADAVGRSAAFFRSPRVGGIPVDVCLTSTDRNCGTAAADRFCEIAGYAEAAWAGFDTPGYTPRRTERSAEAPDGGQFFEGRGRTVWLGEERTCDGRACRALEDVLCIN
jgi:hypothetical protein